MTRTAKSENTAKDFFKENSLSMVLAALFLFAFAGEMFSGWNDYNNRQRSSHNPIISFAEFLKTGTFWDGTFCNWQAAILQLAVLIVFSEEFYQRGASHSRQPQKEKSPQENSRKSKGGWQQHNWIYRNSLALAFWALFLVFFTLHIIFGAQSYNESRITQHLSPISLLNFTTSAKFWFLTLQTWEAEFFAIATFIVLTIFLRQQNSPESKSPDASDKSTGKPNE